MTHPVLEPPRGAEDGDPRFPLTHRVAASAYIFRAGRMLLLQRTNPPRVFAPVGGHLHRDEAPLDGLRREVREETGLEIEVLTIAGVWFGSIDDDRPPLLGLDYITESPSGDIVLNEEHTAWRWVSREEYATGAVRTLDAAGHGYTPAAILGAFDRYRQLRGMPS